MFAVAIDGELKASHVGEGEVVKILRDTREQGEASKIEVASFSLVERAWIPVCVERFEFAHAA